MAIEAGVKTKKCTGCGEEKPLGGFHKDISKPDGVRPKCKECVSIAGRVRRRLTCNTLRSHDAGLYIFPQVESAVREMAELQAAIDKESDRCASQVSQRRAYCEETKVPWQAHLAKVRLLIKKWLEEKYGQANRAITIRCEYGIIRFFKSKFEIELKVGKAVERMGKPMRDYEANQVQQVREAKKVIKRTRYRAFLAIIMRLDDDKINTIRDSLESLGIGRAVVAEHPGCRLYAALKPNRRENLQRIQNVMRALDPDTFDRLLGTAEKLHSH